MKRYLVEEGFLVKDYLAPEDAPTKDLAEEFTKGWLDPDVRAVFPICGSEKIFEVIQYLDPLPLAGKPVIFCGSSILSALSLWLNTYADLVTFFGPHLPFIHSYAPQREPEFTVQSFWSMVLWRSGRTKRISSAHERYNFFSVRDTSLPRVTMRNIYLQNHLIKDAKKRDVSFFTNLEDSVEGATCCITLGAMLALRKMGSLEIRPGSIVFTETMDWSLEQVWDALNELTQAGVFTNAKALFLTALTERTDRRELQYPELRDPKRIQEFCKLISSLLGLPVLYGFPLGHTAYKLTVPQGVRCTVNPIDGSVTLSEPPVK